MKTDRIIRLTLVSENARMSALDPTLLSLLSLDGSSPQGPVEPSEGRMTPEELEQVERIVARIVLKLRTTIIKLNEKIPLEHLDHPTGNDVEILLAYIDHPLSIKAPIARIAAGLRMHPDGVMCYSLNVLRLFAGNTKSYDEVYNGYRAILPFVLRGRS